MHTAIIYLCTVMNKPGKQQIFSISNDDQFNAAALAIFISSYDAPSLRRALLFREPLRLASLRGGAIQSLVSAEALWAAVFPSSVRTRYSGFSGEAATS